MRSERQTRGASRYMWLAGVSAVAALSASGALAQESKPYVPPAGEGGQGDVTMPRTEAPPPGLQRNVRPGSGDVTAPRAPEGAQSDQMLQEIVVTAGRREENLRRIPTAITALTAEDLERLGATTIDDYARTVPGLTVVDLGPSSKKYVIRGVNNDILPTGAPFIQQYLDDLALNVNGLQTDIRLHDLERVEVLRGPQGTLYGSASMGGTIRSITPNPNTREYSGKVELTASQTRLAGDPNYAGVGVVNIPIAKDAIALRVVAYADMNAGYVDNVVTGKTDINETETYGTRATLLVTPTDRLSVKLMAALQSSKADDLPSAQPNFAAVPGRPAPFPGLPGLPGRPATDGWFKTRKATDEPLTEDLRIFNATVTYKGDFASLTSATSLYDVKRLDVQDFPGYFGQTAVRRFTDTDVDVFSEELRVQSEHGGPWKWLVGGYYVDSRTRSNTNNVNQAGQVLPDPVTGQPINSASTRLEWVKAVFADVSYQIAPTLTATAGVRYSDVEREQIFPAAISELPGKTTYRFNLAYNPTESLLVYGAASQGYRTGTVNNVALFDNPMIPPDIKARIPREVKGDEIWNYEIGAKWAFFDQRILWSTAAYWIDWSNMPTQFIVQREPYLDNVGDARIRGIESEVRANLTRELTLIGAYSYAHGEIVKGTEGVPTQLFGPDGPTRKGDRLLSPRTNASLTAEYARPISSSLWGTASLNVTYTGDSYTRIQSGSPNRYKIPSYALVNARLGVRHNDVSVTGFVTNLLDERAVTSRIELGAGIDSNSFLVRPRTVGVTVKKEF